MSGTRACGTVYSLPMAMLMPSFAALSLVAAADVGMPPKRKTTVPTPSAHWGLTNDSASAVALVVLSRLYRSRDEVMLAAAAHTPFGGAVLAALRALALRVAVAQGGVDPALSESNITTLFNMGSSHVTQKRLYEGGLSLPGRLPWRDAKRLVVALYDGLAAARNAAEPVGLTVANLLMQPGTNPASDDAQTAIQALVEVVEHAMVARLEDGGDGSSSSGGDSSAASTPPPVLTQAQQSSFAIDTTRSLEANLRRLVEHRPHRPLSVQEIATIRAALDEGLSVLQSVGSAARQQLLATNALLALSNQGASWLWSAALESTEGTLVSVAAVATAITESCNGIAAMLFASAATTAFG